MHQAQHVIDTSIRSAQPQRALNFALSGAQATTLQSALRIDAAGYFYSGVVSIGDATQAMERSLHTWATVKLYYSGFYMLRAILALNNICLFYDGTKPYSLACVAGSVPVKRKGQTHKVVLSLFESELPRSVLLSQQIDGIGPTEWLMQRREEVNYSLPKFSEPNAPKHLAKISAFGIRKSIATYMKDTSFLYAFDADHAILAYPIEVLKASWHALKDASLPEPSSDELRYLAGLYFDRHGPIPEIAALLKR